MQRKVSLLQEYKQRGNKNVFVDRRFGEQDEGLGEEEKAIMRFQRERQVQHAAGYARLWQIRFTAFVTALVRVSPDALPSPSSLKRKILWYRPFQSQLNRRSKFNLEEDGEGEEDILTHGGQPLSAFDDFDRGGGLDEDDDAEDAACETSDSPIIWF